MVVTSTTTSGRGLGLDGVVLRRYGGEVADVPDLVEVQAALRRVAVVAAAGGPPDKVLESVSAEVSALLGGAPVAVTAFAEAGAECVVVAETGGHVPVDGRFPVSGDDIPARVWRSGRAERVDDYAAVGAPESVEEPAVRAAVAVPVVVDERLWGALSASSQSGPLPATTEDRLAAFADVVAAAVVGLETHRSVRLLADERAAVLRVAGLVARGVALAEVFDAVAAEASRILGDVATDLFRFDDGFATVVAARSRVSVGASTPIDEDTAIGRLRRAGGPLRLSTMAGTARADEARELGIEVVVGVPVTVEGQVWGALISSTSGDPLPADTEDRLSEFAELAAAAIANAENRAKLRASRARVVATADETRQRLQRDVHDGAQQRLVQTVLTLKLGLHAAGRGEETAALMQEALEHAERATLELRDIVHGILPAALSRGGLHAGIDSLVTPLVLPVDLETAGLPPGRLPSRIEVNAYFVVAEALTNVVKHARASRARVTVGVEGDRLVVEVGDDGVGGADPRRGSGLTGLSDRVDVLEGTLSVTSPVGAGTTVRVTLPLPGR
jgi:signal transduction histidine kinase